MHDQYVDLASTGSNYKTFWPSGRKDKLGNFDGLSVRSVCRPWNASAGQHSMKVCSTVCPHRRHHVMEMNETLEGRYETTALLDRNQLDEMHAVVIDAFARSTARKGWHFAPIRGTSPSLARYVTLSDRAGGFNRVMDTVPIALKKYLENRSVDK